ncbi:MAG: ABC transporter permease [Anaerolineae bacterium]
MFYRIASLIRKEFIHIFRDPRSLIIMFVIPLVQLTLLGYAATTDIEHLRTAVFDADKTPQSRALIAAYAASNYFNIVEYVDAEEDIRFLIDRGDARAGLVIPAGYGQEISAGRQADVAFFIDGSDPQVANVVFGASQSVGQAQAVEIIEQRMGISTGNLLTIDVRPRVWYNPNMESSHFIIPGLMVIILYLFTALFTASSIVREREMGTIEQLIVTPIRSIELIVSKVFPYIFIAFFDVLEVLAIGVFWFGVPISGSLSLLLGLAALFLVTALGIGIFISSVASTQQEALLMTMGTMLPTIFLSGFFFPLEAMPAWLQVISYAVPARYALEIMRGIILKGVGLQILLEQVIAVVIFGVVIMTLAASRFRQRLD